MAGCRIRLSLAGTSACTFRTSMGSPPRPRREAHDAEVRRIEAAYRERDQGAALEPYRLTNPAFAFFVQLLEWSVLDAIRKSSCVIADAQVLDVGCGTGYLARRFLDFGAASATGLDLMASRVETARARYPAVRFVQGDGAAIPFADGEFHIVTQFICLSSVLDWELRRGIMTEMWRVTRPGGIVLSFDLRPLPWPIRVLRTIGQLRPQNPAEVVTPTLGVSKEELLRCFPTESVTYCSAALAFGLCRTATRSRQVAQLLAAMPWLREHAIAVVGKPRQS